MSTKTIQRFYLLKNVKIMLDFRRFSMIFDLSQSSGNVSERNYFVQSA